MAVPKSRGYLEPFLTILQLGSERISLMSRFELHPEAARSIDERGNALLAKVASAPPEPEQRQFAAQRVPAAVITENHIVGRMTVQGVNELKKEVTSVRFEGVDGVVGIDDQGVRDLDKLAQLARSFLHAKTSTSDQFLRQVAIDWLQQRFRGETAEPLSDLLRSRLESAVALRTVMIPIANLCLEDTLPFGPIELRVITAEMMASLRQSYLSKLAPADPLQFEAWFTRLQQKTQGLAAATMTIEADELTACELCLERAEQAIALLRVMHPVNSSPHTALYVRPLGSENIESYLAYCYEAGNYDGHREHARWPYPSFWEIRKEEHNEQFLQHLIALFGAQERSDFQRRLFDALLIYSRNNIAKEPADKLIFCLVAIESMLLKDPSEAIQDNIAERMAYLLGGTTEERLEIVSLVKDTYAIRSKFVHHGQRPTDMDTLARFMMKAWLLFIHLLLNMSTVKTKDEMIETLKRLKYK
jgi:hypothetical protein